jgi:SPP1 family predicted phage head-tail adaptor
MRAGDLRHRVTIQNKGTPARNTAGEEVITWTEEATVWGSIEPLRGREFLEQQREGGEVTTRIRIRHRDGLTPSMRAVWGSHTYDILSVIEVQGRQREIHLMCRELVDG